MSVSDADLAERIDALTAEIQPLQKATAEAAWQLNVTGEERWQEEVARLSKEIRLVLSRPEPYAFLCVATDGANGSDPLLLRQAFLLRNAHAENQISPEAIERMVTLETSLEHRFNTFRADLDGVRVSENDIREILERSDDLERRRRAWEASKQIGAEVEEELRELARQRNAAAREVGWSSFYTMSLELDELDETEVFSILDSVVVGTQGPWDAYKGALDERTAARFGSSPTTNGRTGRRRGSRRVRDAFLRESVEFLAATKADGRRAAVLLRSFSVSSFLRVKPFPPSPPLPEGQRSNACLSSEIDRGASAAKSLVDASTLIRRA